MLTLSKVNDRLASARKEVFELGFHLSQVDFSLILGKSEIKDLEAMTWCGAKKHENGLTMLAQKFPIIESTMESVFEICWVIPRRVG